MHGMSSDDHDRLAAEHVIGLLEGEERGEADRLLATDPTFQSAVASWQVRFAELDEIAPLIAPGEALWRRITTSLRTGAAEEPQIVRSADPTPPVRRDPRNGIRALWRNLAFWRAAGLVGALASLALAIGLVFMVQRSARTPVLVAVLLNEANQPAGVINTYRNGQAELIPFEGMQIPTGRAFEVWVIPGPNQNPISVGLVTAPRSVPLDLQRVRDLSPNNIFAISVEPPQGSPTGLPTGPVLLKGVATTAL
jgi:anti-sigma-K factor RskA